MRTTLHESHVGLEIGTSKISVIISEGKSAGAINILSVGDAPSRGVRKGEIINQEAAAECIREALSDASEKTGVEIKDVWLAVSGGHFKSFNSRGTYILPDDHDEILPEDVAAAESQAKKVFLPTGKMIVYAGQPTWRVDGKSCSGSPIGMKGRSLEAVVHIVHGVKSRIENCFQCLRSIKLEMKGVLPSSIASASCVLTQEQKELGALVVDIGGGTTDYVVYLDGAVRCSGVLPLGGDHITSDLSIGIRVPIAVAERVKVHAGSAADAKHSLGGKYEIIGRREQPDQEIDLTSVDTIIYLRVREIFETLRREIEEFGGDDKGEGIFERLRAGVMITGGSSRLRRIDAVAEEVFGLPIMIARARNVLKASRTSDDPEFATTIGLTNYAMDFRTYPLQLPAKAKHGAASRLCKMLQNVWRWIKKPRKEFRTSKENLLVLQKERDRGKNSSRSGEEDLDVPTFLRKGAGGVEIKQARKIE